MGRLLGALDRFQRRHRILGFPLAVVYKFFDDQGNYMAATLTYYAFIAIFPLMLIGASVLGFFLQNDPELRDQIIESALGSFPIIGDQLNAPNGLEGSSAAVIAGSLAALYGTLGLGQSSQNTMNVAWAVPRNSRPNPFLGRGKSLVLLMTAGLAVLAVAILTGLVSDGTIFGDLSGLATWAIRLGTLLLNGLAFTLLFRLSTARKHSLRAAAPGAFAVALMWQLLQYGGAAYVQHVLSRAEGLNQTFAFVLGLFGLIYIAAVMAVLGVEVNVVRTKRLYPRALLTPFTDNVQLTKADRRAYSEYAKAQRHKGFETVRVTFTPKAAPTPTPASSSSEPEPVYDDQAQRPNLRAVD